MADLRGIKKALVVCVGLTLLLALQAVPLRAQGKAPALSMAPHAEQNAPVKCWRLANGLTVVHQYLPGCTGVGLALLVPAGSAGDPSHRTGLAHLTEHLVYRATPDHPAGRLALEWERLGARRGALTSVDCAMFWELVPAGSWPQALAIEAGRFKGLAADDESLANERRVMLSELQGLQRNRWRGVKERALAALAPDKPFQAVCPGGQADDIARIAAEDIRSFYKRYYSPDKAVLAIVGECKADELALKLRELFPGEAMNVLPQQIDLSGGTETEETEAASALSVLGEGPELPGAVLWLLPWDYDDAAVYAVAEALNWRGPTARLAQCIREHGWDDRVQLMAPEHGRNYAAMSVSVADGMDPQAVAEALRADMLRLAGQTPSYPELEAARKRALVSFYRDWQEPARRAQMLAKAQFYDNLELLLNFPRSVRSCTPQQVQALNCRLAAGGMCAQYVSRLGGAPPRVYGPEVGEVYADGHCEPLVLDNGLRLTVDPDLQQPMVYLRGYIEGGSLSDPEDRPGLTCFAAGLLGQGIDARTGRPFATELGERGMTLSFKGDRQIIAISGSCLREDIHRFLDILCTALRQSDPDEASASVWQRRLVADLVQRESVPENCATALLMEKLYPAGHAFGRFYGGTSEMAASFTREEALKHLRSCVQPGRIGLCFSGGINEDVALRKLQSRLGDWLNEEVAPLSAVPPAERARKGHRYVIKQAGDELLLIGQLGPGRQDPDYYAFNLLNQILAGSASLSRLPLRIVHVEHLGTSVSSRVLPSQGAAPWAAVMRLHPGKAERALAIVKQEMARLADPGPSEEEITRAKNALENQLLLQAANPAARADLLCAFDFYRLDSSLARPGHGLYRDITPLQLHVAAKKWFDPLRLTVVISQNR
ncbi:insulinase family protein [bacterium]|nr:insulinase family protein [bacterium]